MNCTPRHETAEGIVNGLFQLRICYTTGLDHVCKTSYFVVRGKICAWKDASRGKHAAYAQSYSNDDIPLDIVNVDAKLFSADELYLAVHTASHQTSSPM